MVGASSSRPLFGPVAIGVCLTSLVTAVIGFIVWYHNDSQSVANVAIVALLVFKGTCVYLWTRFEFRHPEAAAAIYETGQDLGMVHSASYKTKDGETVRIYRNGRPAALRRYGSGELGDALATFGSEFASRGPSTNHLGTANTRTTYATEVHPDVAFVTALQGASPSPSARFGVAWCRQVGSEFCSAIDALPSDDRPLRAFLLDLFTQYPGEEDTLGVLLGTVIAAYRPNCERAVDRVLSDVEPEVNFMQMLRAASPSPADRFGLPYCQRYAREVSAAIDSRANDETALRKWVHEKISEFEQQGEADGEAHGMLMAIIVRVFRPQFEDIIRTLSSQWTSEQDWHSATTAGGASALDFAEADDASALEILGDGDLTGFVARLTNMSSSPISLMGLSFCLGLAAQVCQSVDYAAKPGISMEVVAAMLLESLDERNLREREGFEQLFTGIVLAAVDSFRPDMTIEVKDALDQLL